MKIFNKDFSLCKHISLNFIYLLLPIPLNNAYTGRYGVSSKLATAHWQ